MDIQYVGEHLLPGRVGNFFVVLAFAASLFATIAYFFAVNKKDESWKKLARGAFWIQAISVVGIVVSLAYIIGNHLFEYHYAWAHSSRELPTKYVISCFWEGQEGSFLLWAFWQMVLGIVLIFTAKKWESSVMAVVCLSQVFILSMLLGVDVFGQSIGSSPFILLREALEGPIFQRPDYLALIHDGNGLNPLLQNYWMVIHPPTLFLGFASMVVPFAFAIAGMWERRYEEWIRPALPWALFAVMVLGGGIIMGSFWAYEALNFGGFWAWDPVENASLIPWLTLIAAVHVMLAYRHTGHSYFTALFLVFISFVMVLYASFLTRSGILGETSVHAFTDLGMSGQLVLYIIAFLVLGVTLMVRHWKNFPITKKDEATYSREFWLFIGAIILSISCFQIVVTTSTPVINALFGTKLAPPTNVIEHYNKWQIPLAILVGLISAFAQFLKYKDTNRTKFYISLAASAIVSLALTLVIAYYGEFYQNPAFVLLIFASVFTILANGRILVDAFKGKFKLAGSAVAHIGFGLILVGALIAASKNEVISLNTSGYSYGKEFNEKNTRENILLWKDEPTKMMDYMVTYLGDSTVKPNTYYKVHYQKIDPNSGSVTEDFILYPNAQVNPKMGLIASPDTRHNLLHDIYTHVSSVPVKEEEAHEHEPHEGHTEDEEYTKTQNYSVRIGDTISFENGVIILEGLNQQVKVKDISLGKDDLAVGAKLRIISEEKVYESEPVYIIRNGLQFDLPKKVDEIGAKFRFTKIDPREGKIELVFLQKPPKQRDYIIMKAIIFPYINLLWGGTIIMVIGFLMSIWKRVKEVKRANA
jgi:cytochrome c-type biogenesis protein CcmF